MNHQQLARESVNDDSSSDHFLREIPKVKTIKPEVQLLPIYKIMASTSINESVVPKLPVIKTMNATDAQFQKPVKNFEELAMDANTVANDMDLIGQTISGMPNMMIQATEIQVPSEQEGTQMLRSIAMDDTTRFEVDDLEGLLQIQAKRNSSKVVPNTLMTQSDS